MKIIICFVIYLFCLGVIFNIGICSEAFSRMVDYVSPMEIEWNPTGSSLSSTFKLIVDSANANVEDDPKAKEIYDKLCHNNRTAYTVVDCCSKYHESLFHVFRISTLQFTEG